VKGCNPPVVIKQHAISKRKLLPEKTKLELAVSIAQQLIAYLCVE